MVVEEDVSWSDDELVVCDIFKRTPEVVNSRNLLASCVEGVLKIGGEFVFTLNKDLNLNKKTSIPLNVKALLLPLQIENSQDIDQGCPEPCLGSEGVIQRQGGYHEEGGGGGRGTAHRRRKAKAINSCDKKTCLYSL